MKKLLAAFLAVATALSLTAFSGSAATTKAAAAKKWTVAVSMPTQSLQRWNYDGANLVKSLNKAGYSSILQYANNDVNTQIQQCENMITKGCNVLIIAAIDGASMSDVCATAKKNGVKVIAYDRLIMKTKNVDYYATFDNYKVGQTQGNFIVDKLKLKTAKGPFNIEIFGGDPGDNNAVYFYNGAMDVLKPYISKGKLVVKSGQKDFKTVAIPSWTSATAQTRMDNLITANYSKGAKLDAILSPNDSLAIGIVASLQSHKFGTAAKPYPILTGQDCDIANVKAMIAGQQSMAVWKDTRVLASQVVLMINAMKNGKKVPVNNTKDYNNGSKVVPSYLLPIQVCTKANYKALLVDSGYYKASQLK
jgi:ABC-type xylose transport system, periplasmic component